MKRLRDAILGWAAPRLAYWYLTLVGKTSRIVWIGKEHPEALEKNGKPFAFAFWHGRQAFFTYSHRDYKAAILVSLSKDGEIIAEVMRLSGLRTVRGSTSRGGATALKQLIDVVQEGSCVAASPDGPRGPARQVQPGILFVAQQAGIPIIPIANGMRRKIIFRGWDEFYVPLPFNRVAIAHGAPIHVRPEDSLDEKAKELKEALDETTRQADEAAMKDGD
jgi:lysophospholipid acyltransferase (LPLAT)-like uncharacterized protein